MIDDTANLSIDFLAGFTIFMIAFIYVATLIPGLLLGLQGSTIDYSGVAYRTGVILVEDPGAPLSWENPAIYSDYYIRTNNIRFGLALSKDTPNILSAQKVNRFFCTTFVYPADYRSRAVFGDYPYLFNISLQFVGSNTTQSIGDLTPNGYGYIRRVVQLKEWSNATIGSSTIKALKFNSTANATTHLFYIQVNPAELLDNATYPASTNPIYQIDPWEDQITINLTDLNTLYLKGITSKSTANLSEITILRAQQSQPFPNPSLSVVRDFSSGVNLSGVPPLYLYAYGNSTPVPSLPVNITNNLSLTFAPGFFYQMGNNNIYQEDTTTQLYIRLTFKIQNPDNSSGDWYLDNTNIGPFDYNYNPTYVTQCGLLPGVMEISVW
ncbi:hypothetical protein [Methanoregula sp.]|uniref:hypothetical protein n=1 Tax=Methanoregula sp. TaxID=2052170 RepID=UPI003BAE6F38